MVAGTNQRSIHPSSPPIPGDQSPGVRAVREKVAKNIAKLRDKGGTPSEIDLFSVGYGMLSTAASVGSAQTYSTGLVHCDDWSPLGTLVSRSRARRGRRQGYLRAEFLSGTVYEVFAEEDFESPTSILRDGRILGWWSIPQFTYEGRLAMPLRRELFLASGQRLGVLESSTLMSGCAVLELDPDGATLVPIPTKSPGLICGSPWKEVMKLTPFGRNLGPRQPNLDTVLTTHARALADEELSLFFGAVLAVRAMDCLRVMSSD